MGTFWATIAFAAVYAMGYDVGSQVTIYQFGMLDPKFGGPDGNLAFSRELLPYLVVGSFRFESPE